MSIWSFLSGSCEAATNDSRIMTYLIHAQFGECSLKTPHILPVMTAIIHWGWLVDSPHTHKGPLVQSFDISFVTSRNKLLNKQSSCQWSTMIMWHFVSRNTHALLNKQSICQWFEMPWCSCDIFVMITNIKICKPINFWIQNHWFHPGEKQSSASVSHIVCTWMY